jgi:hypothetical protein
MKIQNSDLSTFSGSMTPLMSVADNENPKKMGIELKGKEETSTLRFSKSKLLPLFKTKTIPQWYRLTIPFVIIFDIFLFVQNNWYEGAFINMSYKFWLIY